MISGEMEVHQLAEVLLTIKGIFEKALKFNPFQPDVAFHTETSHLICATKQITGFYLKCNTALKLISRQVIIVNC